MSINEDVLDKFWVALGFQVDNEGIDKFQRKTEELKAAALRLGAVFAGAAVGIGLMVEKVADHMGELQHFAELNKLSAREVAALNRVGEDNLITNEAMESSIQSLNIKTGEAAAGVGRGAMIFKKFGLAALDAHGKTKTFNTILGDVAAKMQKMSRQANMAMAARLGIDPKMVPLLEKGKAYLDQLTGEAEKANPFSEEDYERALKVDILFMKAKRTVGLFASQIAVALMPAVQKALDKFIAWFAAMRADTASTFNKSLHVMAFTAETLFAWFTRLVDVLTSVGHWMGQFETASWGAKIAVGALIAYQVGTWATGAAQAVMLLSKAVFGLEGKVFALNAALTGGILMAFLLIADDIWNWYHGNESVIGQLDSKYPYALQAVGLALGVLGGAFVMLKWQAITSLAAMAVSLFEFVGAAITQLTALSVVELLTLSPWILIVAAIAAVIAIGYELWTNWAAISGFMSRSWDAVKDKFWEYINAIKKGWSEVKSFFGFDDGPTASVIQQGAAAGGAAQPSAPWASQGPMGMPSHSSSHSSVVHQNFGNNTITVISPDPDRAGQDVQESLQSSHTRTSVRNSQSAVAL